MEKERELELGEKLDEQRRVLEKEHEEALQGKDKVHLGGCGMDPSFHLPSSHGDPHWPLPHTSGPQAVGLFRGGVCRSLDLSFRASKSLAPCFILSWLRDVFSFHFKSNPFSL